MQLRRWSELGKLGEGAGDAHQSGTEVDSDCGRFFVDDPTQAEGVVGDQVPRLELLNDRLGICLERTRGEVSPPGG